jgi:hypothetical protein
MEGAARGSSTEERWLHEANAEAAIYFRQDLLRTSRRWPTALLKDWGVEQALSLGHSWQIGYSPDSGMGLIEHLRAKGFEREILVRAGLMSWVDGLAVDRYQDQLVVVSRDRRLDPVGFVGIDRDGEARSITPETLVHRQSEALAGVLEQLDLLQEGATAVFVDHPLDAIAIELAVRHAGDKRYLGIPLLGSVVSSAQAQILRQYSVANRVIVTVPGEPGVAARCVDTALSLMSVFDHVRVLQRSSGSILADPGRLRTLVDLHAPEPGVEGSGPEL